MDGREFHDCGREEIESWSFRLSLKQEEWLFDVRSMKNDSCLIDSSMASTCLGQHYVWSTLNVPLSLPQLAIEKSLAESFQGKSFDLASDLDVRPIELG